MSVLLLWEHPQEVRTNFNAARTVIKRNLPNRSYHIIESNATWGFYEDEGNNDPEAQYTVEYVSGYLGNVRVAIPREDLQVFRRPEDVTILRLEFRTLTGAPSVNRSVQISDESYTDGRKYHSLYTNSAGKLAFPLKKGTRILVRLGGEMKALDTVVPLGKKEISWDDLAEHGSFVDTDRRGWY